MKKRHYAVIGLGIFGMAVARTLVENGSEVIAIDKDTRKVQEIADHVTVAVRLDATDEAALKDAGVGSVDAAIVCIGESIEANIMAVMVLKSMGIGTVISKAVTALHERLLASLGAAQIVHPERDMGIRLANSLAKTDFVETLELSPEHSIVEIVAPAAIEGQTLMDSGVRGRYGLNVIAVRKAGQTKAFLNVNPGPETIIARGDVLVVLGRNEDIERMRA